MTIRNYLLNAIDTVMTWDLAEDLVPLAINDQAKLMAGWDAEEIWLETYD